MLVSTCVSFFHPIVHGFTILVGCDVSPLWQLELAALTWWGALCRDRVIHDAAFLLLPLSRASWWQQETSLIKIFFRFWILDFVEKSDRDATCMVAMRQRYLVKYRYSSSRIRIPRILNLLANNGRLLHSPASNNTSHCFRLLPGLQPRSKTVLLHLSF